VHDTLSLSVKFFGGEDGRPWKSNVKDVGGELLLVSENTHMQSKSVCSVDYPDSFK
jgi:hypothetical protein